MNSDQAVKPKRPRSWRKRRARPEGGRTKGHGSYGNAAKKREHGQVGGCAAAGNGSQAAHEETSGSGKWVQRGRSEPSRRGTKLRKPAPDDKKQPRCGVPGRANGGHEMA